MFLVQLQFLRIVRKKNENKHLAVARHEPTSFLEKIHRPRKKLQHARILHHCNRNTPLALNTNKKLHHSTKNCAKRDGGICSKNDSMELCIYVLFQLDWHFHPVNNEKRDTHSTNTNITKIHRKLFVGENNSDPINNTELFSEAFFPY
jgi:hypothetical protein